MKLQRRTNKRHKMRLGLLAIILIPVIYIALCVVSSMAMGIYVNIMVTDDMVGPLYFFSLFGGIPWIIGSLVCYLLRDVPTTINIWLSHCEDYYYQEG